MLNVVYLVTNRINGKQYVGKTKKGAGVRWGEHMESSRKDPSGLHGAIKKHGAENFSVEILHVVDDPRDLSALEIFEIASRGTKAPRGYNLTDGGDGVIGLAPESIEAMRQKLIGRPISLERRLAQSIALTGRERTPEHRQALSESLKNSERAREQREKIYQEQRGKKRSAEACRNISEAHKGQVAWNKGKKLNYAGHAKPHSAETKAKISANSRKTDSGRVRLARSTYYTHSKRPLDFIDIWESQAAA